LSLRSHSPVGVAQLWIVRQREHMRKLGYTLLILGVLNFALFSLVIEVEAINFSEQYMDRFLSPAKFAAGRTWTRGQVIEFSQTCMSDFARQIAIPQLFIGATLMFCGGICLDIAGRRKRALPNKSLQATAAAPASCD